MVIEGAVDLWQLDSLLTMVVNSLGLALSTLTTSQRLIPGLPRQPSEAKKPLG